MPFLGFKISCPSGLHKHPPHTHNQHNILHHNQQLQLHTNPYFIYFLPHLFPLSPHARIWMTMAYNGAHKSKVLNHANPTCALHLGLLCPSQRVSVSPTPITTLMHKHGRSKQESKGKSKLHAQLHTTQHNTMNFKMVTHISFTMPQHNKNTHNTTRK